MTTVQSVLPTSPEGMRELLQQSDAHLCAFPGAGAADELRRSFIERMHIEHAELQRALQTAMYWVRRNGGGAPIKFLTLQGSYGDGKTSIATRIMVEVCRESRQHLGREVGELLEDAQGRHVVLPAVAIDIGAGTEVSIATSLAAAVGIPASTYLHRDMTADGLIPIIAGQFRRSRTLLVVIDESQRLATKRGTHLTSFLKKMFSQLGVTLLFVGRDLTSTPLLSASSAVDTEVHAAKQMLERQIDLPYPPIDVTEEGIGRWVDIALSARDHFPLKRPARLEDEDYVWLLDVCGRSRGTLLEVLRTSAAESVGGTESLDRASLEHGARLLGRCT